MAAGIAQLRALKESDAYERLEAAGKALETGLHEALSHVGAPAHVARAGSMWTMFFTKDAVTDLASAKRCDTKAFGRFFHAMLERGIYLPPSQFEAGFVSLAHSKAEIERTINAARESFDVVAA
jgi:glutamate-1-semialdehyde 2,1-aminomutase